jgi:hypothetical protein
VKTFELHRDIDETGVSGTGIIAQGCVFADGWCAMRWLNEPRTTTLFPDIDTVEKIHGHKGKTKIVWTGDPAGRAMMDCYQDRCENVPFGSVGGIEKRSDMRAPAYITPEERASYLNGYRLQARNIYGDDWMTCEFGWKPALTIDPKETP